jgi:glycosyltransferase involved in cell wall biosynthesis
MARARPSSDDVLARPAAARSGDAALKVDLHPQHVAEAAFIAMPMRNEADLAPVVVATVAEYLRAAPHASVLLVDDASTDATADAVAKALASLDLSPEMRERLNLVRLKTHVGKAGAILAAFSKVEPQAGAASHFLFTDGDLAYDLNQLDALCRALKQADVAIGVRTGRDERPGTIRFVMGQTFNALTRLVLGLPHRDTQAGLKGFRMAAARAILPRLRRRDFSFDAEALFIARRLDLRVAEIPASVSPAHQSKPSRVNLILDPVRMALGLVSVRWDAFRGKYPRASSRGVPGPRQ